MHNTPHKQMMVNLWSDRLSLQTEAAKNINNDHERSRMEQCILVYPHHNYAIQIQIRVSCFSQLRALSFK